MALYSALPFARGCVPRFVDFRRSFRADELNSIFGQPIRSRVSRPASTSGAYPLWPLFRCRPLAGFGCRPRSYGNVSVPTTPAWSEGQSLEGLVWSDGSLPMTFALTLLGTWTEKITSIRSSSSVVVLFLSDESPIGRFEIRGLDRTDRKSVG